MLPGTEKKSEGKKWRKQGPKFDRNVMKFLWKEKKKSLIWYKARPEYETVLELEDEDEENKFCS